MDQREGHCYSFSKGVESLQSPREVVGLRAHASFNSNGSVVCVEAIMGKRGNAIMASAG